MLVFARENFLRSPAGYPRPVLSAGLYAERMTRADVLSTMFGYLRSLALKLRMRGKCGYGLIRYDTIGSRFYPPSVEVSPRCVTWINSR